MQLFDVIDEMKKTGVLPRLVESGLIGARASIYHSICDRFNSEVKRRPNTSKMIIISDVAKEFQVEQATIYRARKVMSMQIDLSKV